MLYMSSTLMFYFKTKKEHMKKPGNNLLPGFYFNPPESFQFLQSLRSYRFSLF
jgi:hypothetical protein